MNEKYIQKKRQKIELIKDPVKKEAASNELEAGGSMDIEAFKILHSAKFNIQAPIQQSQNKQFKIIDDEEEKGEDQFENQKMSGDLMGNEAEKNLES